MRLPEEELDALLTRRAAMDELGVVEDELDSLIEAGTLREVWHGVKVEGQDTPQHARHILGADVQSVLLDRNPRALAKKVPRL